VKLAIEILKTRMVWRCIIKRNIPLKLKKKQKKLAAKKTYKKVRNWIIWLVILGLIIWGISSMFSGGLKTLPPTTDRGHIEVSPESHVLREPMRPEVQRHMLEHADGTGPPGVIINYNCEDFGCEKGLIEKLEAFAQIYPEFVYVAPFPNMDAKIALTKLNNIEILEEYDESKISIFISGRVPTNDEFGLLSLIEGEKNQTEGETLLKKEFDVIAKKWSFSPSTIIVNEGDNVILNVRSIDVNHGLAIPKLGINEFLSPGDTVKIEFVANKKGTYIFACSVSCGAGHTGMQGKIVVN